jgi:hypothetical protein
LYTNSVCKPRAAFKKKNLPARRIEPTGFASVRTLRHHARILALQDSARKKARAGILLWKTDGISTGSNVQNATVNCLSKNLSKFPTTQKQALSS